jgi:hypothetical protein
MATEKILLKHDTRKEREREEGEKKKSFQFPSTRDNSCKHCVGSKMWKEICDILSDI